MNRFVKEFANYQAAYAFAECVAAEVIKSYDWDFMMDRMVEIYRVYYTVA